MGKANRHSQSYGTQSAVDQSLDLRSQVGGHLQLLPTLLATACCVFSAIGSFLFGYDTGIIASSISQVDFISQFGRNGHLSDSVAGGIVSSFTAGAIIGTLIVSFLADRYGRRSAIFVGSLFACLGGALQCGANILTTIIIGRIFAGIGVGLMSATIPNYCSEVAHPRIRGFLGGMQQWMIGLGIVTAQWVGYGGSKVNGPFSWRFPLAIQVAPALILACGVLFLPESPRFLVKRGQDAQAYRVLERLHLGRSEVNRALVDAELQQIQNSLRVEQASTSLISWKALCTKRSMRKRLLLACGIQLFTQTSGTNVIGYYGPRIYKALGYSTTGSLFITALYGVLALIFNTICMGFVDKVGRRKLLIPSMVGMGAALCVEATLTKYFNPDTTTNTNALRAGVAMNFVFALFFTSLGVISWIYPSEIFPTVLRARGTSLSTLTNWCVNLIISQCSPLGLSRMGANYFYVFAAFNWSAAIITYIWFPETFHISLEEISTIFGDLGTIDDLNTEHTLSSATEKS